MAVALLFLAAMVFWFQTGPHQSAWQAETAQQEIEVEAQRRVMEYLQQEKHRQQSMDALTQRIESLPAGPFFAYFRNRHAWTDGHSSTDIFAWQRHHVPVFQQRGFATLDDCLTAAHMAADFDAEQARAGQRHYHQPLITVAAPMLTYAVIYKPPLSGTLFVEYQCAEEHP